MAEGLVDLARRYVALSDELETVRGEIRRVMLNGAGDAPRPTQARSKPGGQHPNAIKAQKIDQRILDLLKAQPGMKVGDLAKATSSKTSTTSERLRRMRERGSVAPAQDGGWAAAPPA